MGVSCAPRQPLYRVPSSRALFAYAHPSAELQHCGIPVPNSTDSWSPPSYPTPASGALYVAPNGSAAGDGSIANPFATIAAAGKNPNALPLLWHCRVTQRHATTAMLLG